jgi:hypothetical protein
MLSINKLRKRNPVSNNSDDVYSQYIEDYEFYFENTLNKTRYVNYEDNAMTGKCILLDVTNMNSNGDEKYLTTLPNSGLQAGNILSLDFTNDIKEWIIYDKEHLAIPSHEKFRCMPCNYVLKWIANDVYYELPCVVVNQTKYTGGTKSNASSGITEQDAMLRIILPISKKTNTISLGQRLFTMKNAWRVTLIDDISTDGIISLSLGKSSISANDDIINGICDYYKHKYTISLNSNSETIVETSTYQIVANITDNNVSVSSTSITYTSSDETIATVNSNGLVTAISVGNAIITASIGSVSTDLSLTVTAKTVTPVISYGCIWSNGTSLKTYVSSTANIIKTIDSVNDITLVANYSLDSVGTTLLNSGNISITRKTNTSFQIKNISANTSKSFVITFINSIDSTIIYTQTINLSGM